MPIRKNIFELRNTELQYQNSVMFQLMNFVVVLKGYINEFRKLLLNFFTSVLHTCANKVSHHCYWLKTISARCWKQVDGELWVALSNVEPNVQWLCNKGK